MSKGWRSTLCLFGLVLACAACRFQSSGEVERFVPGSFAVKAYVGPKDSFKAPPDYLGRRMLGQVFILGPDGIVLPGPFNAPTHCNRGVSRLRRRFVSQEDVFVQFSSVEAGIKDKEIFYAAANECLDIYMNLDRVTLYIPYGGFLLVLERVGRVKLQ